MKKLFGRIVGLLFALSIVTYIGAGGIAAKSKSTTIVKVSVNNNFKPIAYTNEKGQLEGYDIAVIKEIDRRLPDYKFVLEGQDSVSNLLGVETGKYAFGSSSFYKNPDREKKYLFPDENYGVSLVKIAVKKNRKDINTIDDLPGKSLAPHPPADGIYTLLKNYNDAHPDRPINLQPIDAASKTPADGFKWVNEGRYDAEVGGAFIFYAIQKDLKLKLKLTGTVSKSPMYFVFNKSQTELKTRVDSALRDMKKDGTLSRISKKWLGEDVFKD